MTFAEALELKDLQVIHSTMFFNVDGTCMRWRINGAIKLWKRSPQRIRIPIKHGWSDYGYINELNLNEFHLANGCKLHWGK